jgi:hypothetical protein
MITLVSPATRWAMAWGLTTALAGAGTLLATGRLAAGTKNRTRAPAGIVVALGLRQLAQGTVVAVAPTSEVVAGATAIDVLHGTSMVAAALFFPRYRRAAVLAAGTAAASAGVGGAILAVEYARSSR